MSRLALEIIAIALASLLEQITDPFDRQYTRLCILARVSRRFAAAAHSLDRKRLAVTVEQLLPSSASPGFGVNLRRLTTDRQHVTKLAVRSFKRSTQHRQQCDYDSISDLLTVAGAFSSLTDLTLLPNGIWSAMTGDDLVYMLSYKIWRRSELINLTLDVPETARRSVPLAPWTFARVLSTMSKVQLLDLRCDFDWTDRTDETVQKERRAPTGLRCLHLTATRATDGRDRRAMFSFIDWLLPKMKLEKDHPGIEVSFPTWLAPSDMLGRGNPSAMTLYTSVAVGVLFLPAISGPLAYARHRLPQVQPRLHSFEASHTFLCSPQRFIEWLSTMPNLVTLSLGRVMHEKVGADGMTYRTGGRGHLIAALDAFPPTLRTLPIRRGQRLGYDGEWSWLEAGALEDACRARRIALCWI